MAHAQRTSTSLSVCLYRLGAGGINAIAEALAVDELIVNLDVSYNQIKEKEALVLDSILLYNNPYLYRP